MRGAVGEPGSFDRKMERSDCSVKSCPGRSPDPRKGGCGGRLTGLRTKDRAGTDQSDGEPGKWGK